MRIRLLDRYLLRELMMPLAVCLGGFMLFYISFDLIGSLNRFQEHQLNASDVFKLYLVKTPEILVFILPIVLLLALLYSLSNHSRNNELVAMRAAGVSLWRIASVYLMVGFIFSLAVWFMNETWVPKSKERQDAIMQSHYFKSEAEKVDLQYNFHYDNSRDHRQWVVGVCDFKEGVLHNPQVFWKENQSNWHLFANRAENVDGTWTFYGYTSIASNDIANLHDLAFALKQPDSNIAQFIRSNLSSDTVVLLNKYTAGENPELKRLLASDFNHFLRHGPLYEQHRFYGVKLSEETVSLIARKPEGTDLVELNFLLLADAFPLQFFKRSANSVVLYRGDPKRNQAETVYLYTNRLVMPRFTETLNDFQTEVTFNNHFLGSLSTESAEVPTLDLMNYLSVHPDLSAKYRAWLKTQLHGRIAMPWTCLVVVLIAIPFGSMGGRRNIFMGVAGSIIICFAYFVLLKTSLAFGTAGMLPGWLAAWLPNALFGFLGYRLISRVQ